MNPEAVNPQPTDTAAAHPAPQDSAQQVMAAQESAPQAGAPQTAAPQVAVPQTSMPQAAAAGHYAQPPHAAVQPTAAQPTAAQPTAAQPTTAQFGTPPLAVPQRQQPAVSPQSYAPHPHYQPFATPGAPAGSGQPAMPVATAAPDTAPKSRYHAGVLVTAAVLVLAAGLGGGVIGASLAANNGGAGAIEIVGGETSSPISAIAAARTESVVTLEVQSAGGSDSGSGVVYRADGYIITNAHVALGDGSSDVAIKVRTSSGELLPARLIGADPYADLAVVKVDRTDLTPMPIGDSGSINVGDTTVAIGAPLELPSTVTSGVVSAVNRGIAVRAATAPQTAPEDNSSPESQFELPGQQQNTTANRITLPVIQTDASINPGNSGGALLNGKGELIGINVAIASTSSADGVAGSVGLGFAIPSELAVRVVDALIAGEKPSHGLLGASVADATGEPQATHAGGLVVEVTPDSAAARAGLQPGDIITTLNGITTADGTSVSALVRMHPGGSEVELEYYRNGELRSTVATLGTL